MREGPGVVGREAGGLEGGPGEEGTAAGSGHGLHNEERIQVPPRRLTVTEGRRDPDIAAGGSEAGVYSVFGLQAANSIKVLYFLLPDLQLC